MAPVNKKRLFLRYGLPIPDQCISKKRLKKGRIKGYKRHAGAAGLHPAGTGIELMDLLINREPEHLLKGYWNHKRPILIAG